MRSTVKVQMIMKRISSLCFRKRATEVKVKDGSFIWETGI